MKRTIPAVLAVLCLLALAPPLQAQEGTTTKEQDIRRLLELTGSAKLAEQIMELLGPSPVDMDELARACGATPAELSLAILELDLAGRIELRPGGVVASAAPA